MYTREVEILHHLRRAGDEGLTVKELAKKIGRSQSCVRKWLDVSGHWVNGLVPSGEVKVHEGRPARYYLPHR